MDPTKFEITKDIKKQIRKIVPTQTDTLEIVRGSRNRITVYAVWEGVRIGEAVYALKVGESLYINGCSITIDFEDEE